MIAVVKIFVILICSAVFLMTCTANTPRSYAMFELPGGRGMLVFRSWWGLVDDGYFDVFLRTDRNLLLSDVVLGVPHLYPRLNIYATPDGNLAMLGTANSNLFVVFDKKGTAEFVSQKRFSAQDSARWIYLGAFVENRKSRVNFHLPNQIPECIPLIGDSAGPYRHDFQENRCDIPSG